MKPWLIGLLWLSTTVSAAAPPSGHIGEGRVEDDRPDRQDCLGWDY